jgi:spore coat-associated protein N
MAKRLLRRFALSAALLGLAASLVVIEGTHAGFTGTSSSGPATWSTGVSDLAAGAAGPANRLTVDATGVVPGDRIERAVDLINRGTLDLSGITLTTSALQTSALDTDTTHGLDVGIDRCSVPWTEAGTPPGYVYGCAGTTSVVLAARPVIGAAVPLAGLTSTTVGNTDHLRVVLRLPATAGDTLQGLTSQLQFVFTGASAS